MAQDIFDFGGVKPEDMMTLVAKGEDAVAKGEVTPKQMKKVAKKLGLPEVDESVFNSLIGKEEPKNPYTFDDTPMLTNTSISKSKSGKEVGSKRQALDTKTTSKNMVYDEAAANDIFDIARNMPEYQDQLRAQSSLEDTLNMMGQARTQDDSWIKPLLALADAQTGSNLAASFTPQGTKRSENILKYKDALAQRKADTTKSLFDTIGKLKSGSEKTGSNVTVINQGPSWSDTTKKSAGETAVDKEYAKDYNDFILGGGYTTAVANLDKMGTIVERLGKEKDLTGGFTGAIPKGIRDFTSPESANLQDEYEQIVQQNLKTVLGAQFTQQEATQLIRRSFNPRLGQEYNAKRILEVQSQMAEALEAKKAAADYFEANGYSMRGYTGATKVKIGDKSYDVSKDFKAPSRPGAAQSKAPTKVAGKPKKKLEEMSDAELAAYEKELGIGG